MLMLVFDFASYTFSPYAIPTVLASAITLLLGVSVLIRERGSTVSLLFFLLTIPVSLWLFCVSWLYLASDENVALWWARAKTISVTLIPPASYHFTTIVLQIYQRRSKLVWLGWLVSALLIVAVLKTDAFVRAVQLYPWGYYPRYDWLSLPFPAFFFGVTADILYLYWSQYRAARPGSNYQLRAKGLMLAFAVGYVGSIDFLPVYGLALYPFGYLAIFGFALLAARAIWRYRLVDITAAFAAKEIVHAMADALLVLDPDGVVQVANRAAGQLFGKPERDLFGAPISTLTGSIPMRERLDRQILTGAIRDFEVALPAERGEKKTVSLSSFAMRDRVNQPLAIVCIAKDITEHKRAEEQIERNLKRMTALYDINLAITTTMDLRFALDSLLEKIDLLLPSAAAITVRLFNEENRALDVVASRNVDEAGWSGDRWKSGRDLAQLVFETRAPLLVSNVQTNPGIQNPEFYLKHGWVSFLGIPLTVKDRSLGVLSFYTRMEQHFTREEVEFLTILAGLAAMAIHNSLLSRHAEARGMPLEEAG
ncbi:MAG: GAF domain-containing protein [Deltaproteobacteria bacterium]|nr:GAF domain-containing protein [Deltaproteobacteria bacterium]